MFLLSYSYGLRLRQFYVDFVPADRNLIRKNVSVLKVKVTVAGYCGQLFLT